MDNNLAGINYRSYSGNVCCEVWKRSGASNDQEGAVKAADGNDASCELQSTRVDDHAVGQSQGRIPISQLFGGEVNPI
ncbi:MAG TPA: hypothetical protein VKP30_30760, partial [Polyangiaceae bacterium]|nr:hypothetical protein [Polyangiaceae bacterium]